MVTISRAPTELDAELAAPEFARNPYPTYRRLREEAPVHWMAQWDQWLLSRYADVIRVLREPEVFSSSGWEARFLQRFPVEMRDKMPHLAAHFQARFLSITDPPDHARLRRPIVKALTPQLIEAVRPTVERIVDDLLDTAEARGRFDAVRGFGYPLPAAIITHLMGLPERDREEFMSWSEDVMDFLSTGSPSFERAVHAEQSMANLRLYLQAHIQSRRSDPDDSIISLLVESADLTPPLDEDELIAAGAALVTAGHETTANLIGNGLYALLRQPEQMQRLRTEPELTTRAVEEFLRFDAPLQRFRRVVRQDLEMHGRILRQGQLVMAFGGSANHDPAMFEEPDRLDVGRWPNPHLAFGNGIHFCPGAALSRLEGRIAIQRLVARFPDLRLADDEQAEWRPNIAFRGLARLPVLVR
jgi:cytochrome P450